MLLIWFTGNNKTKTNKQTTAPPPQSFIHLYLLPPRPNTKHREISNMLIPLPAVHNCAVSEKNHLIIPKTSKSKLPRSQCSSPNNSLLLISVRACKGQ